MFMMMRYLPYNQLRRRWPIYPISDGISKYADEFHGRGWFSACRPPYNESNAKVYKSTVHISSNGIIMVDNVQTLFGTTGIPATMREGRRDNY